jgi:hypothetical protein
MERTMMDPFMHLQIVYTTIEEMERREALARHRGDIPIGPSVVTRMRQHIAAVIYWIGARIEPAPSMPELPCAEATS